MLVRQLFAVSILSIEFKDGGDDFFSSWDQLEPNVKAHWMALAELLLSAAKTVKKG